MDSSFWHKKWETNDIAFHENKANPLLIQHFKQLAIERCSRIFLPLCGKTLDIAWLLSNDYRIVGAELSKIAIEQLFSELGLKPSITKVGKLEHYSAKNIDIFVGDIFLLTKQLLGEVDAIYDRAALVALPEKMRHQYTAHLTNITQKAPQLLICFEYDQSVMSGPPFSISNDEIHQHYSDCYQLNLLSSTYVTGGLKGLCPAKENVWLLQ
jgi:thiopurine S-methyltransferase